MMRWRWFIATNFLAVSSVLAGPASVPPALADAGMGSVNLLATRFDVRSAPHGWHVLTEFVNKGDGAAVRTLSVSISGTGPGGAAVGPVTLAETRTGVYEGQFEGPAGTWNLALSARPTPGGSKAVPFAESRGFTLSASGSGEATPPAAATAMAHRSAEASGADQEAEGGGGGGGGAGAVVAILLGLAAVGGSVPFMLKRRR